MKIFFLLFCVFIGSNLIGQSLTVNPNPFVQRTQVCYTLTTADTVTIVIYNRWGQEVLTVVSNSIMPAGIYCDSLIMDAFEDNVYFLSFKNRQKNFLGKQVIKSASTSIQKITIDAAVKIYPNPVTDKLTIEIIETKKNAKLTISNHLGQIIITADALLFQALSLSAFSPGIYYLKIEGLDSAYKIIKVD